MKKQLLVLAMCLTVSSVSVHAATTTTKSACPVKPAASSKGVKAPGACPAKAATVAKDSKVQEACPAKPTPEQMKKEFEARMVKERELLYNNLNLTKEQKAKAEELHKKNMAEGEPLMAKIRMEKAKLLELKSEKACAADINEQKKALSKARNEFKKHMKSAHKDFEAILTKEQKSKLEAIKAERKSEMKKLKNCKKGGHHGPDSEHMGPKPPVGPDGKMIPPPPMDEEGPMPPKKPCLK